jgi:hypothetical protein
MRAFIALLLLAACSGGGGDEEVCMGDECQSDAGPRILTLSTNVSTLDERAMLVITAVVTDPDGVDDLIGGALVDPEGTATYGAFATSAAEGAYELRLPWGDIDRVRPIDAPAEGASRMFRARFYDVAGHVAEDTFAITLRCSVAELGVCGGDCVDLRTDERHCGMCNAKVPDGTECQDGIAGCVMGPESTPAACSDGCSNDGDAYIDCNDFNCCSAVSCPTGTSCNP